MHMHTHVHTCTHTNNTWLLSDFNENTSAVSSLSLDTVHFFIVICVCVLCVCMHVTFQNLRAPRVTGGHNLPDEGAENQTLDSRSILNWAISPALILDFFLSNKGSLSSK